MELAPSSWYLDSSLVNLLSALFLLLEKNPDLPLEDCLDLSAEDMLIEACVKRPPASQRQELSPWPTPSWACVRDSARGGAAPGNSQC